ncbi:hypothetical protein GCM10023340_14550 [Nocardioides marinquilinus]|uniref:DNA primase n=1 Tax=Nocardioides marinquilinus TaxID=1210400 RepID=A0ABP9PEP4_9ACTN
MSRAGAGAVIHRPRGGPQLELVAADFDDDEDDGDDVSDFDDDDESEEDDVEDDESDFDESDFDEAAGSVDDDPERLSVR